MQIALEQITPELARPLLERNAKNRRLNPEHVRVLAGAMERGEWQINGETIKIAEGGDLLDGQHRLRAVCESGATIETLVMRGLPAGVMDTLDQQRKRRLADILNSQGFTNTVYLAAALTNLHKLRSGAEISGPRHTAPSPQQALALLDEAPELEESAKAARSLKKALGWGPIGVYAALQFIFTKVDPEATEDFFDRLAGGYGLMADDPILRLRNTLTKQGLLSQRSRRMKPEEVAAVMIKAFNACRNGEKLTQLVFRQNEEFPTIAPSRAVVGV